MDKKQIPRCTYKIDLNVPKEHKVFQNDDFILKGIFTKWKKGKIREIIFKLKNLRADNNNWNRIKTVYYCNKSNTVEIHLFSGTTKRSYFTAKRRHLNKLELTSEGKEILILDYSKDKIKIVDRCFTASSSREKPEVVDGSIIVGT